MVYTAFYRSCTVATCFSSTLKMDGIAMQAVAWSTLFAPFIVLGLLDFAILAMYVSPLPPPPHLCSLLLFPAAITVQSIEHPSGRLPA